MTSKILVAAIGALMSGPAMAGQPAPHPRTELYRFTMIQAAPGRSADLIALYREHAAALVAAGDELPILVRHSQGDRWDALAIYPMGSFTEYYTRERVAKRERAAAFTKELDELTAWHEDVFVQGPPLAELRAFVKDAGLAHLEMLQSLAGRRDELVKEREMENVFNVARGRPATVIFTREQGAAWDVITLDVWRDWRQYGELQMIPADVSDAAARKAGFASADAVGVYMRTLIATHHDTLGPIVPLAAR